MTAIVWANVLLTIPFLIAFIGIPLWMTLRRQSTPDHSQAHAYLGAKAALAEAGTAPVTSGARPGRLSRRAVLGRRSAATGRHDHARQAARHVGAPA
jgi:uncharacterized membrane protein YdfJ with MMPL/SSD domain